jgi:PAS domain S-box-containing protein
MPLSDIGRAQPVLPPARGDAALDSSAPLSITIKDLILIVDENEESRTALGRLLQNEYRVHLAGNEKQAIEEMRLLQPALVLTEATMPAMDGFELLRAIRTDAFLCSTPVILLSAQADEDWRVEGLERGADDFLEKSCNSRELRARVATHVRLAKLRREAAEREARLRLSAEAERKRLQEMLAQSPDGVGLLAGPELRWSFVNQQFIQMVGRRDFSDFLGKTFAESLPEVDAQGLGDLLEGVYRSGQAYTGPDIKLRLNRDLAAEPADHHPADHHSSDHYEDRYFDFVFQPIRNDAGCTEGILLHAVEVTDKVTASTSLWESERRLRALVAATSYSTYSMSPDWSEMRELKGAGFLADTTEPNRNWLEQYILPDDQTMVMRAVRKAVRSRSFFELEHRVRRADGSVGWTRSRAVPLCDTSGEITEWFGAASDVTDHHESDQSRYQLAAIVDSAEDAIVSKDLNGIVRTWNAGAERLFGYSAAEMIGQPILRIFPAERHSEEEEILRKVRKAERLVEYETVRLRKDREPIDVSVSISPIRDQDGRVVGASKIARDISGRKRMERLLVQSEKLAATGRMAASIAHEINNPLESLINLIFLARQCSAPETRAYHFLVTAEQELERVSHIARQTLGYYRDSGAPVELYFHDLIENVLTVYHSKLINAGIAADVRFNDLGKILVSQGEMLQVVSNVIANAIDSMPRGGKLSIVTRAVTMEGRRGIETAIQDNGSGIEPGHLPNVFEPFFTTKGDLGTGIGLWVARQLVETRGGKIHVASSTEKGSSGTTVTIFIPFAYPQSVSETTQEEAKQ